MSIKVLLEQLAEQRIEFWLEGESLRYRAPKNALSPQRMAELKANKQAIIEYLKAAAETPFDLSYGQRALWFLYQSAPQSPAYNVAFTARILSPLNVSALETAFLHLVSRHDALRMRFIEQQGEPQQWIDSQSLLDFQLIDSREDNEEELQQKVKSAYEKPFVLATKSDTRAEALFRVCLFQRSEYDYVLLMVFHHIIGDGWSLWLLLDELEQCYPAVLTQQQPKLKPKSIGFKQFALQQMAQIQSPQAEQDWQYWQAKFSHKPPLLNLPCKRPYPQRRSYFGASYPIRIDAALVSELKNLARQQAVTPYILLLATYQLLLHRYSGQNQLCIGTPVSGREQEQFQQVVGYFVNPLPLLSNYSPQHSFSDFLKNTAQEVMQAIEHQDFPLAQVIERLKLDRDSSRPPLFQAAFVFQQMQKSQGLIDLSGQQQSNQSMDWAGLKMAPYTMTQQEGQFDLSLELMEAGGEFIGALKFNTDVLDGDDAQRIAQAYENLLQQLSGLMTQPLKRLQLLSPAEKRQIVEEWNDTQVHYADPKSGTEYAFIPQLLSQQAEKSGDRTAVIFAEQRISYAELEQRSNQLAHYLIHQGAGPETLIAVHMQRSVELVWTLLGILKAGAAYLPLDPDYPQERISYMLENAGAKQLLTQAEFVTRFASFNGQCDALESLEDILQRQPHQAPEIQIQGDNLAYVIYTSGSTGQPKGVPNTHIALRNRILWMQDYFQVGSDDLLLQKTPYSFDVSVWEFVWPFITGAGLVVAKPGGHKDSDYLVQLIQQHGVTTIHFVPSMLQLFMENTRVSNCQSLQRIICSGEALPEDLHQQVEEKLSCGLFNLYGPTEAAIDVSAYACKENNESISRENQPEKTVLDYQTPSVPIGKPIDNLSLYVLDEQFNPQPIGVAGDLYIGGIGLARGYWQKAQLTADKFVPNPFVADNATVEQRGQRLYRTGDIAYYRADGNIEFLGRSDGQVKLRGLRIELGEIEAALKQSPQVKEAVVNLFSNQSDQRLVAYLTLMEPITDQVHLENGLRNQLREQLPEFMLPSTFMVLDEIPLSSNGKVDRKALPPPLSTYLSSPVLTPPQTQWEKTLASIWSDVLGHERFGRESDFFQVDGHSLLALRLVARINERLHQTFGIEDIFSRPTLEDQAELIEKSERTENTQAGQNSSSNELGEERSWPVIQATQEAIGPMSYSQERLWFVNQLENARSVYHIPLAFRFSGKISISALQNSLRGLIQRHPALRTAVLENNVSEHSASDTSIEKNLLRVIPNEEWEFPILGLETVAENELNDLIAEAVKQPFDLENGQAIKAWLITLQSEPQKQEEAKSLPDPEVPQQPEYCLLIVMHHLMSDGWSLQILLNELDRYYRQFLAQGSQPDLAELSVQYHDFSRWQRQLMAEGYYQQAEDYWRQSLANIPTSINLPHDKSRPREPSFQGAMLYSSITPSAAKELRALGQQSGCTPYMTLLAIFALLLARYSGQNAFMIGTPMANRRRTEVEGLIGLFVNTVLMRIEIDPAENFAQWLKQVRQMSVQAFQYQHYPFERLVEQLQPQRDLAINPLFQAMYVYQESSGQMLSLGELELHPVELPSNTAKCDLSLYVTEQEQGWQLALEYSTDLFVEQSMQNLLQSFVHLTETLVHDSHTAIARIPLLAAEQQNQIITQWNQTEHRYSSDLIPSCLSRQSQQTPQQIAIRFEDQKISYQELEQRSNQLAHYLIAQGVGTESLVAVSMQRSAELVISLLAILKAGAAYLPLDPDYPEDRLHYMLHDGGATILLSQPNLASRFQAYSGLIILPQQEPEIENQIQTAPEIKLHPDNLAYVIYTSGSTGLPKGVPNTHGALLNRILWMQRQYQLGVDDVAIQKTPYSFDVSVWEFFWPLIAGAGLVVAKPGGHKDPEYLAGLIQAEQVTTIHFVPSMLAAFMNEAQAAHCQSLKHLICSGEALGADLVDKVHEVLNIPVQNLYGPTEAAIDVSVWECQPKGNFKNLAGNGIPIGRPIDNLQLYILDPQLQPVPAGVPGNLYIAGAGLARGYYNRPGLTAEKFIANPFTPGERMYDTGDIARFMPDGVIEYMGRRDGQVKIRGLRIELGEIEATILPTPGIKAAAVKVWENERSKFLAAYLVTETLLSETEQAVLLKQVQSHLHQQLPEHMCPVHWLFIDELPLNTSGKLDRKQLPEPQIQAKQGYMAAESEIEQQLVEIWQRVLGVEPVGIGDNYFDLGGDSILSIQVVSLAKQAGIQFRVEDLILYQNIAELAKVAHQIDPAVAHVSSQNISSSDTLQQFPLTATQYGMLYHALYDEDQAIYSQQVELTLAVSKAESFDSRLFYQAWLAVFNAYQALQSAFVWEDSQKAFQHSSRMEKLDWQSLDWRDNSTEQQESEFQALKVSQQQQGFILANAPLSRFQLIRINSGTYRFLWTYHHLLMDGWSLPIVLEAVSMAYQALVKGQEVAISECRPFSDYVDWLEKREQQKALDYWRTQLEPLDEVNQLPTGLSRVSSSHQATETAYQVKQQYLSEPLSQTLSQFIQQQRLTLATLMQASWTLVLNRLCSGARNGKEVFGITVSGRPAELEGVDKMVGLFINTIPAVVSIRQQQTVRDWLQEILNQSFSRETYSYLPLSKIAEVSSLESAQQLLQSLLVVENYPLKNSLAGDENPSSLSIVDAQFQEQTNYPLTLVVIPGDSIQLKAMYQCAEFDSEFVDELLSYWMRAMAFIADSEHQRIGDFQLLNNDVREYYLRDLNRSKHDYSPSLIPQLLTQQAKQTPDQAALFFQSASAESQCLSYAELEQRSNRLAHFLIHQGVTSESLVAVSMHRSMELVISLLAIVKSGAAYLPLDPDYPLQRLHFMLQDAGAKILLTQPELSESFADFSGQIMMPHSQWEEIQSYSNQAPQVSIHPANIAYVIYTSGSTGKPKGVPNTHEAFLNRILWMQRYFQMGNEDCVVQKTPYSFDVSVWEFFWPFICGAKLAVAKPGGHKESDYLIDLIQQQQVTTIHFVPSMLQAFMNNPRANECRQLKRIICSGEALPRDLANQVQQQLGTPLFNLYGPTEAAIDVSVWACEQHSVAADVSVPIGHPIDNLQLYILDQQMQPVPAGVPGDLYIGGIGLARGYYKRPALTAEKFVVNPFAEGERLYRTGDIARFLANGAIDYLGRSDNQIKLRGLRIETGEIESRLKQIAGISDAAVKLFYKQAGNDKSAYLAAYLLVPDINCAPAQEQIRESLLADLPDYMIPAQMVFLEQFPLSSNGKLDYKALAEPEIQSETEFRAAENDLQARLVEIWESVLGVSPIGILDNYFDLGGDSILSIQIVARAKQAGIIIDLKTLIDSQTIMALAQQAHLSEQVLSEQGVVTGEYPTTPIQSYFFHTVRHESYHFNQSVLLEVSHDFDPELFQQAFTQLLIQHDNLRLRWETDGDKTALEIMPPGIDSQLLQTYTLQPDEEIEEIIQTQSGLIQRSLRPEQGELVRALWIDSQAHGQLQHGYLLIVIHHMVVDGVSWRILLEDLHRFYEQCVRNAQLAQDKPLELLPKTSSYSDWAKRIQEWANDSQVLAEAERYWCPQAKISCFSLPIEKAKDQGVTKWETIPVSMPETKRATLKCLSKRFSSTLTQRLLSAPRQLGTTLEVVLISAIIHAVKNWSITQGTLAPELPSGFKIELEGHGREDIFTNMDISRTVGWFTSLFPLVIEGLEGSDRNDIENTLKQVEKALRGVPQRGLNYGVLRYLCDDEEIGSHLAQSSSAPLRFNYLGRFTQQASDSVFLGRSQLDYAADLSEQQSFHLLMDINSAIYEDQLSMDWRYSEEQYSAASIEYLLVQVEAHLEQLLQQSKLITSQDTHPETIPDSDSEIPYAQIQAHYSQAPEDIYPLSPLQQGILSHAVYAQQSESYLQQVTWYFHGDLDVSAWKASWQELIEQHSILRSAFNWDQQGKPWQIVLPAMQMPWLEQNYSKLDDETSEQLLNTYILEDRHKPFDVEQPPLIRLSLIVLNHNRHFFLCTYHHLLLDGWSLPKLIQDLFTIYAAKVTQQPLQLTPRRPFKDYIDWLQEQNAQALQSYWREQLSGFNSATKLAIDQENELSDTLLDHLSLTYEEHELSLSSQHSETMHRFARSNRVTINTLLQGAWALLLSHYSGARDILFATTVSGRPADLADVDEMLGLFINTLPVRVKVQPEQSVALFLQSLLTQSMEREPFAYAQLADIQRFAELKAGEALFDSLFIFENYPMDGVLEGASENESQRLSVKGFQVFERTDLPLTLLVTPGAQIHIKISYQTSRYKAEAITALMGHYQNILQELVANSEQTIGSIGLCHQKEQLALVQAYNPSGSADYVLDGLSLHGWLLQQAQQTPDRIAVEYGQQCLTYQQLHQQADQLARILITHGAGADKIVAICMERSPEMLVSLLAVLKSGAAYLPLDPGFPPQRLQYMLDDAGVIGILKKEHLPFATSIPAIDVNEALNSQSGLESSLVLPSINPDQLAYVIYTSGSTGKPKGVQISHRNIVNFIQTMAEHPGIGEEDRLLAVTTISFDIAALELYLPLVRGARVVLADAMQAMEGFQLKQLIEKHQITMMQATPATWRLLMATDWQADHSFKILCGGEALSAALAQQLQQRAGQVWNLYGPTETAVWSMRWLLQEITEENRSIKLGEAIGNTQIYILDDRMQPVPLGMPGELMIAGDGVARGYKERFGLTAERFIPNPYGPPGSRMYRTGDLVRRNFTGELEYISRRDFQAKIRGYRIELGEIETALEQIDSIEQAVVTLYQAHQDNARLVAYIRKASSEPHEFSEKQVREALAQSLPSYMIPSDFIMVQQFSLTGSGKVDRKALPEPEQSKASQISSRTKPQSELQQSLSDIWQAVLQRDDFGIDDNFFDMGGHSLLLMQVWQLMSARIENIPKNMQAVELFRFPTIAKLAERLVHTGQKNESAAVSRARTRAQQQKARQQQKKMRKRAIRSK